MGKNKKDILKRLLFGLISGAVSAAAGMGGGLIIVPYLKKNGLSQKTAQKSAVAAILPISALSAAFYIFKGFVMPDSLLLLLPVGVIGAAVGIILLDKIPENILKILFSGFMIYGGVRLLLR